MPRKREGIIRESLEDLQRLEAEYRGKPEAARITVLRLLKEDPKLGIEDAGTLVGYSKPTVKRWWRAYREGGLDGVIQLPGRRQPETDQGVNLLKQKLLGGEFNHLDEVRVWLEANRGRRESRGRLKSGPVINGGRTGDNPAGSGEENASEADISAQSPLTAERLIRFVSALPLSHNIQEWSAAFRKALQALLGDVDRVSISLNVRCDLQHPERYNPDMVMTQSILTGTKAVNTLLERTAKGEGEHLSRLIDNLRRRKFPFEDYHQPHSFIYYYGERAYLGILALWRERNRPDIAKSTLEAMDMLQAFMIYILSDFVARHQMARPIEQAFNVALDGVTRKTGLTMQERRIMTLQLLGLSYEEVASTLNISLNTVRYHLRSIYNKTGAHSQAELFAKYFTPRFDPNQTPGHE